MGSSPRPCPRATGKSTTLRPPALAAAHTLTTDLAQQLLRVCPLLQLVDHHYRVKGAASLGAQHPLHRQKGGQSTHRQCSDVGRAAQGLAGCGLQAALQTACLEQQHASTGVHSSSRPQ